MNSTVSKKNADIDTSGDMARQPTAPARPERRFRDRSVTESPLPGGKIRLFDAARPKKNSIRGDNPL